VVSVQKSSIKSLKISTKILTLFITSLSYHWHLELLEEKVFTLAINKISSILLLFSKIYNSSYKILFLQMFTLLNHIKSEKSIHRIDNIRNFNQGIQSDV